MPRWPALLSSYALYRNWQEGKVRAARRAAFLDEAKTLFDGGLKAIRPDGFPRISGTYRGHTFDIQAVPDTLNIRKLPTLWVLVTLGRADAGEGHLRHDDASARRGNVLETCRAPGADSARSAVSRMTAPSAPMRPRHLPPRGVLEKNLAFFDEPRAKELVISPKGLRVVWLSEEAHRGKYLIFRDSEMGLTPFPASELKPILDYLISLQRDLLRRQTDTAA